MKNSILVAVIAATTMLAACASKDDAAVSSKAKPGKVSEKAIADLGNGTWVGGCVTKETRPSLVGAGSEGVRLEFSGNKINVSDMTYASADCTGEAKETSAERLTYTATSLNGVITADILENSTVDMIPETSLGKFSISRNGLDGMTIKALVKADADGSFLVGKFQRELPANNWSPEDEVPAPKAHVPAGSERF